MKQTTDTLLDINSLLAGTHEQILQLLCACYSSKTAGPLTPEQLASSLADADLSIDHTLLVSLQLQSTPATGLSAESYALAAFIDQLFNNYHKNNHLHPDIQKILDRFRLPALLSLCRGELPWLDKHSPLKYMRFIVPAVCGWQPEMGKASIKFKETISNLVRKLANSHGEEEQRKLIEELQQFLGSEQQRIAKLEQRLRDAEIGQLHARHAQQISAKTINQQIGGKQLPASISRFLKGPWRESMRLVALNHGKDSEQWRRIVLLTETLVWTFQPIDNEEGSDTRQHIYDSISQLSEELREAAIGLHHSNELDEELARVEAEHLKILKQQPLEYAPFDLIDNSDPLLSAQVSISNNLIKNVSKINEGQWFIHHAEGGEVRIKLTIKIDQAQQLLFTNFLGIKVSQFSYEEFAYMLSSKIVTPLGQRDILKTMGEKMLQSLLTRYHQQNPQVASEEAVEDEILRQQEITRQVAREKALLEAKALAEASRLKASDNPAAPTPEPATEAPEQSVPEQSVTDMVNAIKPGARLTFKTDADEKTCRLAAILQTTGAYIFVNKEGIKEYSLSKDELGEMLEKQQVNILDQGSDSSSALEQVVNNFRSRK